MEQKYIKLSEYARKNCINYRTAYNHWTNKIIKGKQLSTGTILVESDDKTNDNVLVATYARVSSSENKSNLESQSERLRNYAYAKGYKISKEIKEIGSGLNDERKQLYNLLKNETIKIIIVEHKDRFCRYGINYIDLLLNQQGRKIEIINEINNDKEDLMQDFVSIITSFCARIYGKRRTKRKTGHNRTYKQYSQIVTCNLEKFCKAVLIIAATR
jgi:predicted site-specific integrase-resolvase